MSDAHPASGRRLRIALVGLTHPFRGGISHYTTLLCQALRERHDVRFHALYRQYPSLLFPGTTQIDTSSASLTVEHEARLDSINPWTWIATAMRIRRERPDLIVISWWHPFFAPAFGTLAHVARLFGGVPACFLCHNAIPHERSFIDGLLLRYAFSAGRVFIAHSRQDHDDLKRMRPSAIVHQSPHPTYGVFAPDEPLSTEQARRQLGLSGRKVLLFFGFIREYKGLVHLLEALQALSDDASYHLVVVGEFYEDRARYEPALTQLVEAGRLTLVDRYVPNEDVHVYFSAADLVMVPYLSATQSGVIQIAYGFRKPVIATAVGGIPDVVDDGATGFLVPAADGAAMALAVRRYFESTDHEAMRESIDRENEKYSWERMVETIERVCAEIGD